MVVLEVAEPKVAATALKVASNEAVVVEARSELAALQVTRKELEGAVTAAVTVAAYQVATKELAGAVAAAVTVAAYQVATKELVGVAAAVATVAAYLHRYSSWGQKGKNTADVVWL